MKLRQKLGKCLKSKLCFSIIYLKSVSVPFCKDFVKASLKTKGKV